MKKVLALVLAVIMVCTMAFAVKVEGVKPYDEEVITFNDDRTIMNLEPGAQIVFDVEDFYNSTLTGGVTAPYTDTAGKFVPEKNFVDIAFGAGADLVASKGWVKIADGSYKYVITLKDNANKLLDNTADLVIDKITASIYGNSNVNTWKYASDDGYRYVASAEESVVYMLLTAAKNQGASAFSKVALTSAQVWLSKFDVGYVPNVWHMNEKIAKTTIVDMNNVTYGGKIVMQEGNTMDGKTMTKGILDLSASESGNPVAFGVYVNVKVGDSFFASNNPYSSFSGSKAETKLHRNIADNDATVKFIYDDYSITMPATIQLDNAEGYKLYAVDTTTGNVTLIPTTTDAKGITTAKVTSVGYMVLVKGELTATATPTPGTTTNPGTGANDVVGVAAVLAVVALVSGAAISLKK